MRRGCPHLRFDKFCLKDKLGRKGRNPASGEDLYLEATKVVSFQCSEQLKDSLNGRD
ncbi:MAG: HU family DNA-binding protein [Deltaproteobacteria bacterium]|nr:HU family DNA-binding protein [Deltaproteobacteria bacterium]